MEHHKKGPQGYPRLVNNLDVKTCQFAQKQSWIANILELLFGLSATLRQFIIQAARRFGYVLVDGEHVLVKKLTATAGAVSTSAPEPN